MDGQLIARDISMSVREKYIEQYIEKSNRKMEFVYKKAKLDEIKDQTRAEPLIRQFKPAAFGLNEPLR